MSDPAYQRLLEWLQGLCSGAVAFSGGADSGLLLALARDAWGGPVAALTLVAPDMARQEISDAAAFAAGRGVPHELVEFPMPQSMENNPPERCYLCKRALYEQLIAAAVRLGFDTVLDGTNLDDLKDYRPGLRAVRELGVPKHAVGHPGEQRRSVVLIDEIDKAPRDVPNDILVEIENMQFDIPELSGAGRPTVRVDLGEAEKK